MSRLTPALTLASARAMEAQYRKLPLRSSQRTGVSNVVADRSKTQKRVGWLWHSPQFHGRGARTWFTTNLYGRAYPSDAVFVPVWADCEEDCEED